MAETSRRRARLGLEFRGVIDPVIAGRRTDRLQTEDLHQA
jgi:hypothetical protein